MNKADLIAELATRLDGNQRTATAAVENMLDIIVRSVAAGESITIMGFGTFERRERATRTARNPHTGETIKVPATLAPAFRPGNYFREIVRDGIDNVESSDGSEILVRRSSSHAGFGK